MDPQQLEKIAIQNGWTRVTTKNKVLLSFKIRNVEGKKIKLNIYFTTGTIGVCQPKRRESYRYKQTMVEVERLFQSIP